MKEKLTTLYSDLYLSHLVIKPCCLNFRVSGMSNDMCRQEVVNYFLKLSWYLPGGTGGKP
jgi:hypothetical protein